MAHPPSPDPVAGPTGEAASPLDDDRWPPGPEPFADRVAEARARLADAAPGGRVIGGLVVVIAVVAGGWWLLRPPAPPAEAVLPLAAAPGATTGAPTGSGGEPAPVTVAGTVAAEVPDDSPPGEVVAAAAGAVVRPGVYRLVAGDRVDDLVRAAGGLAADADGDRVNLAAPVADGERVWVPRVGDEDAPEIVAGTGSPSPAGGPAGPGGPDGSGDPAPLVDLNTATGETLETLPGVGPATSAAIIAHREQHGPFGTIDDLLEVRGIGPAKLEAVRPLVTV